MKRNLDAGMIAAGEKLVSEMKCAGCHTATFHRTAVTPRLAGQTHLYLVGQTEAFRDARRSHPSGMVLKDATAIENAASYLASLR
jgi:cytochrome c553